MKKTKSKMQYKYHHVLTIEEVGIRFLMLILFSVIGVAMYFSWISLFSCNPDECTSSGCSASLVIGTIIWFIFNAAVSILDVGLIVITLFSWEDSPKIKVRKE